MPGYFHGDIIIYSRAQTRICASLGSRMKFKTLFMSDFDLPLFLICQSNSWPLGV